MQALQELDRLDSKVFVEASQALGVLRFQSSNPDFAHLSADVLDRYDTLTGPAKLLELDRLVRTLGISYEFVGDAERRYRFLWRILNTRFECDSPFFEKNQLYPFQHVGCNLAVATPRILLQWTTGAGKTIAGTLVAQKLFELGEIDIAIVFCKKSKLIDWERFFKANAKTTVWRVQGERKLRHHLYNQIRSVAIDKGMASVVIVNYEKARDGSKRRNRSFDKDYTKTDLRQLYELIKGKHVLFIYDEAQKMGNRSSLTSKGLRYLSQWNEKAGGFNRMMALTATPYTTSPYNVFNIFGVLKPDLLGTKADFEREYVAEWRYTQFGGGLQREPVRWHNLPKLGKRIESNSHLALKSDPEIAAQFPEMVEREVELELSQEDEAIYSALAGLARSSYDDNDHATNMANFGLLRLICNTAEGLRYSSSEQAARLIETLGQDRLKTEYSAKFEAISDLLETILEARNKVVVFSFWRNATLRPYLRLLRKRFDVPIYQLVGGMKDQDITNNIDAFNDYRGPAIFLSSDAGQEGLNLYSSYLVHVELPYTHASYRQRSDRIHRSDSRAKGIDHCWIYRFVTRGTVEERVNARVFQRKYEAELIMGQADVNVQQESLGRNELKRLMFGEQSKGRI